MKYILALLGLLFPAMALQLGQSVNLPKVQDSYGKTIDLQAKAQEGKYLLFWFYPKAKSPGCTAQGKRYSELYGEFQKLGVEVYGVSGDPAAEQCSFIEELSLKGAMLPDKGGTLAKLFGVGGLFGFYSRDTILVTPQGKVQQVWRNVNPFRDADTVMSYVQKLK